MLLEEADRHLWQRMQDLRIDVVFSWMVSE